MRRLLLIPLLTACGPSSPSDTTDTTAETTTAETTAPPTSSETTDIPTSPLSSDTTPPTTDPPETTATTTEITTDGTTTDLTTTETTTTETTTTETTASETTTTPDTAEYAAFFFAGGLDHILIHKSDPDSNHCTTLHLARPSDGAPGFTIDAPEMWGPQNGGITMTLAGCLSGMLGDLGVPAIAGTGTITWQLDPNQLCPDSIAFNLDLEFPQDQPWVPASEHLEAMDIPVQDCQ